MELCHLLLESNDLFTQVTDLCSHLLYCLVKLTKLLAKFDLLLLLLLSNLCSHLLSLLQRRKKVQQQR